MSKKVVAKYGGTSMAQPEVVAEVFSKFPEQKIIVVSAPGKDETTHQKMTDKLSDMVGASDSYFLDQRDEVIDRFLALYSSLGSQTLKELADVSMDIIPLEAKLDRARILSAGEQLSAIFFSNLIEAEYEHPTILFDSCGCLIHEQTTRAIQRQLGSPRDSKTRVIPGFYGKDKMHRRHLLNRGGSDRTGALYAAVLGWDYQNWTDSDGIKSADPRLVYAAKTIAEITRREVREGAHGGSGVFQGDAIVDLNGSHLTVEVRNTFNPGGEWTKIVNTRVHDPGESVISVTGRQLVELIVDDLGMANSEGYLSGILDAAHDHGLSVQHVPSAQDYVGITFANENPAALEQLERHLQPSLLSSSGSISIENMGAVTLVGEQLKNPQVRTKTLLQLAAAMTDRGFAVEDIVSNRMSPSLTVLVAPDTVDSLVKMLHKEFIEAAV